MNKKITKMMTNSENEPIKTNNGQAADDVFWAAPVGEPPRHVRKRAIEGGNDNRQFTTDYDVISRIYGINSRYKLAL